MADSKEILVPGRTIWSYWLPQEEPFFRRPLVRIACGTSILGPLCAWFISTFFQLRGYVSLLASRIDLGIATIICLAWAWIIARSCSKRRNALGIVASVVIVVCAFALDRFAVNPSPPKAVETSHSSTVPPKLEKIAVELEVEYHKTHPHSTSIEEEKVWINQQLLKQGITDFRVKQMLPLINNAPCMPALSTGNNSSIDNVTTLSTCGGINAGDNSKISHTRVVINPEKK